MSTAASQPVTRTPPPSAVWRMLSGETKAPRLPRGLDAVWTALEGKVRSVVPRRKA